MLPAKNEFLALVRHGQLCRILMAEWLGLTSEQQNDLIRQGQNTPPLTYSPVSLERKNLLRSYMSQGLLPGLFSSDLNGLTAQDAEFLIRCAEDNRWTGPKSLFDYYRQTDIDTAPANPRQLSRIIALENAACLDRSSPDVLLKLSHLCADWLIIKGELKRREGRHVLNEN
jgi:hypothetical protein